MNYVELSHKTVAVRKPKTCSYCNSAAVDNPLRYQRITHKLRNSNCATSYKFFPPPYTVRDLGVNVFVNVFLFSKNTVLVPVRITAEEELEYVYMNLSSMKNILYFSNAADATNIVQNIEART